MNVLSGVLLGVDGFGPLYGWPAFFAIMAAVILGGGILGYAGRVYDNRNREGRNS